MEPSAPTPAQSTTEERDRLLIEKAELLAALQGVMRGYLRRPDGSWSRCYGPGERELRAAHAAIQRATA